jgi:heat shock protein HspQ
MVKGTLKMEEDANDGRAYSSGICLCDENDEEEIEQPQTKKARTQQDNNKQLTEGCKCGG